MSSKTSPKQMFIYLDLDYLAASSGQSDFAGAVDGNIDGGNEWYTVSKITEPYNTYPCSLSPHTELSLEYIHLRLVGVSYVTTTIQSIADTGATQYTDTNYGSFLSYHLSSSGNYVTIGNGSKDSISGYGTTLVILRV